MRVAEHVDAVCPPVGLEAARAFYVCIFGGVEPLGLERNGILMQQLLHLRLKPSKPPSIDPLSPQVIEF